jgi:hypothetical protein
MVNYNGIRYPSTYITLRMFYNLKKLAFHGNRCGNSLDQLLYIIQTLSTFYKTSFPDEEVNCTRPSPSVRDKVTVAKTKSQSYKKL